jgi:predicted  nucleic acid-binding Zn-ribbon protein
MLAPHTTCPGCQEEVFLDELVRGRCPLCGCTLEDFVDQAGDMDEIVERSDFSWLVFNYFIFKKFDELGANPMQVMNLIAGLEDCCLNPGSGELLRTKFEFDLPMKLADQIRPKKCSRCGRLFFRGGRKILSGNLGGQGFGISYICTRDH